jgi:hypothetical protein
MKKKIILFSLITVAVSIIIKMAYIRPDESEIKKIQTITESKKHIKDKDYVFPNMPYSGSYTTNTKKRLESPNFIHPSSEWQSREFDFKGKKVFYEFGKGNPPEVALSEKELEEFRKKVGGYSEKSGYMTPEAEMAMKRFLDNPNLPDFINKAYKGIGWYKQANRPTYPHNLDMENLMYIDQNTGLKRFRYNDLVAINEGFVALNNPVVDDANQPWRKYLTTDEKVYILDVLQNQFSEAMSEYIHLSN